MPRIVALTLLALAPFFRLPAQTSASSNPISVKHFVAPAYPPRAWLARVQGTVVADVRVSRDGTVQSVTISSPYPLLRKSVEVALNQWLFEHPAATTTISVSISFQLDADCPQTGSREPATNYYIYTQVSADLPSSVEVRTCLPIVVVDSSKSRQSK